MIEAASGDEGENYLKELAHNRIVHNAVLLGQCIYGTPFMKHMAYKHFFSNDLHVIFLYIEGDSHTIFYKSEGS